MPRCDDTGSTVVPRPAACSEAAAAGREVLRALEPGMGPGMDGRHVLLSEEVVGFWTEHSERVTVPSALAALGDPKAGRDYL